MDVCLMLLHSLRVLLLARPTWRRVLIVPDGEWWACADMVDKQPLVTVLASIKCRAAIHSSVL